MGNTTKALKVVAIGEQKTAKDGRNYRTVSLAPITFLPNGQEILGSKVSARNFWEQDPSGRPDPLYNQLTKGKLIEGEYVTAEVAPYDIDGRTVNTYGSIVLAHENWKRVFENAGHEIAEATMEVAEEEVAVD